MPRRAHHEFASPACCSCRCDGGCAPAPCYYPAPVPVPCHYPSPPDHLLHAIAAHLLLGSSAPAPAPSPQSQPPPPSPAAHHSANPYPYPHHHQYQQHEPKPHACAHPPPQSNAYDHGGHLIPLLLRRVTALESALLRCVPPPPPARQAPHPNARPRRESTDDEDESESSTPPPQRRPPHRPTRAGPSPATARELAARTIQVHFRRFLARRSRTLRQLKELAVLRSKAAALRGSLSGHRCGADPAAVSEAATGLLLRLDAIQGGDPMIREGKRAVSRELTRILEFVHKVLVKEHEQLAMGNALDNDDYHQGCSAEFMSCRPAVTNKKVSFSSNGQIHELNGETDNVKEVDEGSCSADTNEVKDMPGKRGANGKPGLAAPAPVHMESRSFVGERI